jgi:acetolactate synthase-1/2/3 large subunit
MGAVFIANTIRRTPNGEIVILAIVPAAGIDHAINGIGMAFLGGNPIRSFFRDWRRCLSTSI